MGLSKTLALLQDDKIKLSIQNIRNLPYELPYIMTESLKLIDDENILYGTIEDKDRIALCIMLSMYFKNCFYESIEDLQLDKLLQFGKIEIYKIQAYNGLRFATVNEVKQGARGLIPEFIYPAGENEYKLMCLLQWTFYGKSYFFRQAGYKLNYENGVVTNSFWDMASMCAPQLMELFNWIADRKKLEKCIKLMSKMKKAGGYKYAQFEKDEVEEDITVKQLIYNIESNFPRNSYNVEYRKVLAWAIAKKKNTKVLTPYEISQMREIYDKFALDKGRNATRQAEYSGNKLKEECDFVVKNRYDGVIDPNHFAYTIISTLDKTGYKKCSTKQYAYIEDAINQIKGLKGDSASKQEQTMVLTDDEIDMSLESLSNAIGAGLFED